MKTMSALRLIIASFVYHWRMNLAVACGVAAGTAVLTGALLVGDSMRGSLRQLTLDRLGRIDDVLVTQRFFRRELADELAGRPEFGEHFASAAPAILIRASLENTDPQSPARANRVNLIGCDPRFLQLGNPGPRAIPDRRQIVLNRPAADRLGVKQGDTVLLRLPRVGSIPADSPLGQTRETTQTWRLTLADVIPAEGLGRFALSPDQRLPLNAYVSLDGLAGQLDRDGLANSILVAGRTVDACPSEESDKLLQSLLRPKLEDYGIRIERTERGYFNITSDRMLISPVVEQSILESLDKIDGLGVEPALTYLANTIACGSRQTPYSTITAVDFGARRPLGPFLWDPEGDRSMFSANDAHKKASVGRKMDQSPTPIPTPDNGQIVLNQWAADDLEAKPGDTIRVTYFDPESTHGRHRERTVELRLAAVCALAGAADDPNFTPSVEGVTDQLSMADWDPPFPFDGRRIRDKDELYWDRHKATPKAFVSPATGRKLWSSRFGRATSIRVAAPEGMSLADLRSKLALDPTRLGFVFQAVKRQGLTASSGATPFSVLFLSFSFFIIAAAVMLVALLFRLGIDGRATSIGILLAVGLRRRQVARLLLAEGLLVAAAGSLIGLVGGIAYAALMLAGLQTLWLGAIVTPFLRLHATPVSLIVGYASGLIVALAAIALSVRRAARVAPNQLLAGRIGGGGPLSGRRSQGVGWLAMGFVVAAIVTGLAAARIGEEIRAGAFFGAGALVLTAGLMIVWCCLRSGATGPAVSEGRGNLGRLALRNAARNPGRSTLTIGLVAATCFLIVSVSAFHLDPTGRAPALDSGDGGFALVAQSDQPIHEDFNTPSGRSELGFSAADTRLMADTKTFAFRVRSGDDASCLNLYKARQPRVLGVPRTMIERGGFAWANALKVGDSNNPWLALEAELGNDHDGTPLLPVVMEKNTATYSLHLWKGLGQTYDITDAGGRTVRLKIVGLLAGSIFQGDLLVSERQFLKVFPDQSGYRFFLTELPGGKEESKQTADMQNAMERRLGDYGFAAETTARRLAGLLAVQNTYLSTFQSLGGLGLLLGTFGLAAVQLRNVLERRAELALMRAAGFRRAMLARMVMIENGLLLIAGLGCGVVAALVALIPHLLAGSASVPWLSLTGTLLAILAAGLTASLVTLRPVLTAPLLTALREE